MAAQGLLWVDRQSMEILTNSLVLHQADPRSERTPHVLGCVAVNGMPFENSKCTPLSSKCNFSGGTKG